MPIPTKPKLIQVRSASLGESCVILFFWLAFGVWGYNHHENTVAARRLPDPVSTEPEFLKASCHRNTYRSGPRNLLVKTYIYVPTPPGGPKSAYEIEDSIPYDSAQACQADVGSASSKHQRLQVWYDRRNPWKSSWTLEETSSKPILWFFGAGAAIIVGLAIAAVRNRRMNAASGKSDG